MRKITQTRNLKYYVLVIIATFYFTFFILSKNHNEVRVKSSKENFVPKPDSWIQEQSNSRRRRLDYPFITNFERKDWHDHKFIKYELSRIGPGEQGKPHKLKNPKDIARNAEMLKTEGFFPIVSDQVSVNRSVPDTRHKK